MKKSNDYVIGICSYSMLSSSPIPHEWHMQYVDENKKDKIHPFPTKLLKNIYLKQFENLYICTDAIYILVYLHTSLKLQKALYKQ